MIIENILPNSYRDHLKELICNSNFSWYWNEFTQEYIDNKQKDIFFQFTHTFYDVNKNGINSEYFKDILPIIYFFEKETGFKIKSIFKIKANLLTKLNATNEEIKSATHRDIGSLDINNVFENEKYKNYVSFVYYVTDSDGDTVIYDDNLNETEKSNPISGNLIWFKSTALHHATPPKINKRRIIINFVLEKEITT